MARTNATQTNVEETAPAAQDDIWGEIEEVALVEENAPDERLVAMLKKSEAARVAGADAVGYRLVVANGEVAKSRIAEIRKAGGVKYAACGVGITTTVTADNRVEILFKARKRRGSDKADENTGEGVTAAE